jgi:zinc protease
MRARAVIPAVALTLVAAFPTPASCETPGGYAVVVSRPTLARPEWKRVVDALVAKHGGRVVPYDALEDARPGLADPLPRYACFVATPTEATREFVAGVHRLTRRLDDDPYTDVIWGILTGYDADNALRIARQTAPLTVRRVLSATEVALDICEEGAWYSELQPGRVVRKRPGQPPTEERGPADSTRALVDGLNAGTDLVVTSGHASERNWQLGYRYRNGTFRSEAGRLFGVDLANSRLPVASDNPKVYLAVGNCRMGHVNGTDAMALAWMNSAGVCQMAGYTVDTWFGYGGWGCLDYFLEQPGRFTLAEAFYANQQALIHKLETEFPRESRAESGLTSRNGLLYDRDAVAFYGDPAWEARMAPGPLAWDQTLTVKDGEYRFTITPRKGADSFRPVSTNGSQRGGRPAFALLPHRVRNVVLIEGSELRPVVADNFVLVPLPESADPGRTYTVAFRAESAERRSR